MPARDEDFVFHKYSFAKQSRDNGDDDYVVVDSINAVTVDEIHGFVYWSDEHGARVRRATLEGSNHMDIYNSTKDSLGRKLCDGSDGMFIGLYAYQVTLSSPIKIVFVTG